MSAPGNAVRRRSRFDVQELRARIFMTSEQVAELLGISTKTLADWRAAGVIPFYRIGERRRGCTVFYKRAEVMDWIESCRVPAASEVQGARGEMAG